MSGPPLFLSTVDDDMRADKCLLFLDLKVSYICRHFTGKVEGPSPHHEQLPFKERGSPQTDSQISFISPPSIAWPGPYTTAAMWNTTDCFWRIVSVLSGSGSLSWWFVLSIPVSFCNTHQNTPWFTLTDYFICCMLRLKTNSWLLF